MTASANIRFIEAGGGDDEQHRGQAEDEGPRQRIRLRCHREEREAGQGHGQSRKAGEALSFRPGEADGGAQREFEADRGTPEGQRHRQVLDEDVEGGEQAEAAGHEGEHPAPAQPEGEREEPVEGYLALERPAEGVQRLCPPLGIEHGPE